MSKTISNSAWASLRRIQRDSCKFQLQQQAYNKAIVDEMIRYNDTLEEVKKELLNNAKSIKKEMKEEKNSISDINKKLDSLSSEIAQTQELLKILVANQLIDEL